MSHANYEIISVEYDRVFITDVANGLEVSLDKEFIFEELSNNFPGKRIILRDRMGGWVELIKNKEQKTKFWYDYFIVNCIPYEENLPDNLEITGCPNSVFIRKESKPTNKINASENFEKYKNVSVKKIPNRQGLKKRVNDTWKLKKE